MQTAVHVATKEFSVQPTLISAKPAPKVKLMASPGAWEDLIVKLAVFGVGCCSLAVEPSPAVAGEVATAGAAVLGVLGAKALGALLERKTECAKAVAKVTAKLPRQFDSPGQKKVPREVREAVEALKKALDYDGLMSVSGLRRALENDARNVSDALTAEVLASLARFDPRFGEPDDPEKPSVALVLAREMLPKAFTAALEACADFQSRATLALAEVTVELVREMPAKVQAGVEASNRKWHGAKFPTGRSDLPTSRIRARPTELLLPRYCVTPFVDPGNVCEALVTWAAQEAPGALGRLYVAPVGVGKTRLGIEFLRRLEALGWRIAYITRKADMDVSPGALADFMAGPDVAGVCFVVDDAESLRPELVKLAEAAHAAGRDGPPIRIVAFARSPLGWWDDLASEPSPANIFDPDPFLVIEDDHLSVEDRSAIYAASRSAFAERFREFGLPYQETVREVDLSHDDRPLIVVARAYFAAAGVEMHPGALIRTLYDEERRHWRRALRVDEDDQAGDFARAVAQIALVGGATSEGAAALLRADDSDRTLACSDVLSKLRHLYGQHSPKEDSTQFANASFIRSPEPDLLAQHTAIAVLVEVGHQLLWATLRAVLSGPPHFKDDAERILENLAGATRSVHDRFVQGGAERVIASLASLVPELTEFQLGHLANSLPSQSTALTELAIVVARRLVELASEDSSETGLKQRADAQCNLSARLSKGGYDEEALVASAEAVTLHRRLVETSPSDAMPGLSSALHLHSGNFMKLGRRKEALAPAEEALQLDRELADRDPGTYDLALASSLRNVGETYAAIGRTEDALNAVKDAVDRIEAIAADQPTKFLPALASALNSLSNRFWEAGKQEDAFKASSRAVDIYRGLVAKNRDAHLSGLAAALNNMSRDLQSLRRLGEALAEIGNAVEAHRELTKKNRKADLFGLAIALQGAGIIEFDAGHVDRGIANIEEAIEYHRELYSKNPEAIAPDLVRSLLNYGLMLTKVDRLESSVRQYEEACRLIRPLAIKFPIAFGSLLEQARRRYWSLASELWSTQAEIDVEPTKAVVKGALPDSVAVFDEADRLLDIIHQGVGASVGLDWGADFGPEDAESRHQAMVATEESLLPLQRLLTAHAGDDRLKPIVRLWEYLLRFIAPGDDPSGEAEASRLGELVIDVCRARVAVHPQDAEVRHKLAHKLFSSADDPSHGAAFLDELYDLARSYSNDSTIGEIVAWALHVECGRAAADGDSLHRDLKLDALRDLSIQHSEDAAIGIPFVICLGSFIETSIEEGDDHRRDMLLNDLRGLNSRLPGNPEIRLQTAKSLFGIAMAKRLGGADPEAVAPLMGELWELLRGHPDDSELLEWFRSRIRIEDPASGSVIDPATLVYSR